MTLSTRLSSPIPKGHQVINGVKQNYYMFKRPKVSGIYWIGYEYDGAYGSSCSDALSFLGGSGWEVVEVAKPTSEL